MRHIYSQRVHEIFAFKLRRTQTEAVLDRLVGIAGTLCRVDVFGQITHRNDRAALLVKVLHVALEVVRHGVDPRVKPRGDTVKRQHADLSILGLTNRPNKFFPAPIRP